MQWASSCLSFQSSKNSIFQTHLFVFCVQSFVELLLIITIIGSGCHRLSLLGILARPTCPQALPPPQSPQVI